MPHALLPTPCSPRPAPHALLPTPCSPRLAPHASRAPHRLQRYAPSALDSIAWFPSNWPWTDSAPANPGFFVLRNAPAGRGLLADWWNFPFAQPFNRVHDFEQAALRGMWPVKGASLLSGNKTTGPWLYMTPDAWGYSNAPVTHIDSASTNGNSEVRERYFQNMVRERAYPPSTPLAPP